MPSADQAGGIFLLTAEELMTSPSPSKDYFFPNPNAGPGA